MEIIELIRVIKNTNNREFNNACGELIRRTCRWINPNVRLKDSIFTQICHKYHINESPDSVNDIFSIYNDSMATIINNIKFGKLDEIQSLNDFKIYSKKVCANFCKEFLRDSRSKGKTWVPRHRSEKNTCLVKKNGEFIRDSNQVYLKLFYDEDHAKEYIEKQSSFDGEFEIIRKTSINDPDILNQINDEKIYYEPIDEGLPNQNGDMTLSFGQVKMIEDQIGIHKKKISSCRLIFEICFFKNGDIREEYAEFISMPGNEDTSVGAFKTKKSRCFKKLIESIRNSIEFRNAAGSVHDYIDLLFGNNVY